MITVLEFLARYIIISLQPYQGKFTASELTERFSFWRIKFLEFCFLFGIKLVKHVKMYSSFYSLKHRD